MEWSHLFVVEDACQWAVNCVFLVGRLTQLIFISDIHLLLDDQHRNTNMNDKDHLVGQLTKT